MKNTLNPKSLYKKYKIQWKKDHGEPEFAGMEPACFNEWKDNEFQEMLEKALCFDTAEEAFCYIFEATEGTLGEEAHQMIANLKDLIKEGQTFDSFFLGNENVFYYRGKYYWGFYD